MCCAFGFAACGNGNSKPDGDGEQEVSVESVTLNENALVLDIGGTATLTAAVLPENADDKMVTWMVAPEGKVTVDEWKAALSKSAFLNYSAVVVDNGGGPSLTLQVDIINNTLFSGYGTYYDRYYTKTGEQYFKYNKNGETWIKEEINKETFDKGCEEDQVQIFLFIPLLADKFNSFTYDAENDNYHGENIEIVFNQYETYNVNIDLKFEGGKVANFKYYIGEPSLEVTIEISNYGSTVVELPKVD